MARFSSRKDPDRFLFQRDGNYYYRRRVPGNLVHSDERAPTIRTSLKTDDLALARIKRDLMEEADNILWASMVLDEPRDPARARYEVAMKRVEALGLTYRSAQSLAANSSLEEIVTRLEMVVSQRMPQELSQSVAGGVPVPAVTVRKAFEIYCDEIVPDELVNKSVLQKAQWKKVKLRAVNNFVNIVGDKAMGDITRDDAMKLYKHWLERIAPKEGRSTHSASSGNRDIGNMRVLYEAYFTYIGEESRQNPFSRLSYASRKKRSRPPFPRDWLIESIMKPGNLATLNDEARGIVLALIETGARPSELANLTPTAIRLSHKIPHIAIEPRDDPDDPREIKTGSSERIVPLVGVALEVFKKHKYGFPRYRNREDDLSAALNKYFKENNLFPTTAHKIYSFRHSFEDRMKEAGLDDELRRILMGHAIDRPRYGSGGSLEWRRDEMNKIALPFNSLIV